jgi:hypothetical protein
MNRAFRGVVNIALRRDRPCLVARIAPHFSLLSVHHAPVTALGAAAFKGRQHQSIADKRFARVSALRRIFFKSYFRPSVHAWLSR